MRKIFVCLPVLFWSPEYLSQVWPGQVHTGVGVEGGQELHQGLDVAVVDHLDGVICASVF